MTRRRLRAALAVGCLSILLGSLLGVRGSAAAFTATTAVGPNTFVVDRLANYFSVTPGADAVATGDVDTLAVNLGFVASARTFTSVFTVTNVSGAPQTAKLTLAGVPQVAAATFNVGGSSTITLAPGASSAVSVRTSPTTAGRGAGSLELRLSGSSWLYRAYPLALDQAPEPPASLTATARAAGRIQLSWPASTTTNLAGYDVYRATGAGSLAKIAAGVATTYDDTATVDGSSYRYVVRATSSGAPSFASLDSPQATAIADATAPSRPTVGAGAYVNAADAAAFPVTVTLPAGSVASDTIGVAITDGAATVATTAPATAGAGTVVVSLDARTLAEGAITVQATSTDAAGNVSTAATGVVSKDTVAPGIPTTAYIDNRSVADAITGAAEAGATITAMRTAPSAAGPYTTVAAGDGSFTLTVEIAKRVSVTYSVTATDAAGNVGSASIVTFATTK